LLGSNGPISPDRWRSLGLSAAPILEELAGDGQALPTRRARALEGLVAIGAPNASKLLVRLVQSEEEPFVVRLAAVRGVGRTFSALRQVTVLRPVLEGAHDAHLRAVAAEIMARHASGCPAVRAQLEREAPESRAQFEAALRRCARK
jgi:HEAT repeat protein